MQPEPSIHIPTVNQAYWTNNIVLPEVYVSYVVVVSHSFHQKVPWCSMAQQECTGCQQAFVSLLSTGLSPADALNAINNATNFCNPSDLLNSLPSFHSRQQYVRFSPCLSGWHWCLLPNFIDLITAMGRAVYTPCSRLADVLCVVVCLLCCVSWFPAPVPRFSRHQCDIHSAGLAVASWRVVL